MRFQQVKYKLINRDNNTFVWLSDYPQTAEESLYPAPKNWDKAEKTLKRSVRTFGMVTELSKDLEFTKKGAQFLRAGYIAKDIEASYVMEEWRYRPDNEAPYLHSEGVFDFSDYVYENKRVKIPFKSGGLNSLIKAKFNEKLELEREESLYGDVLDALTFDTVALTTREILLISKLETAPNREIVTPGINGIGSITAAFVPNLSVISNSDQENVQPTFDDDEQYFEGGSETAVTSTQLFYNNSNVAKTFKIRFQHKFRCRKPGMDTTKYWVRVYRYNFDGSSYNYQDLREIQAVDYQPTIEWVELDAEETFTLDAGDSLRLGILTAAGSGTVTSSYIVFEIDHIRATITEDSTRPASNTKALLMHEIGDRLMQIFTGEKTHFYSEFYGRTDIGYAETAKYALTAVALGFWIRKFDDEKYEVSLKDYLEASNAVHNTGYTVEKFGDVEKLILEDMRYFFQNVVTIKLPQQVTNLKRSAAKEFCNASLVFGYKKPNADNNTALYQEAMGLDEYNTKSSFTTPITRTDTIYEKISAIRADSYGREFCARKPILNYPEEDTRYDKEGFFLDCKRGDGEALVERLWRDDYVVAPENVYSPETATGLRLTPFHMLERHEWFFNAGLHKHTERKVRFANKVGNSELITQRAGEDPMPERAKIPIPSLSAPLFTNQWVEFEHPIDYEVNKQLYGRTVINGRSVPNYFGLAEYINDEGKKEKGFVFLTQGEKPAKFKVLRAF